MTSEEGGRAVDPSGASPCVPGHGGRGGARARGTSRAGTPAGSPPAQASPARRFLRPLSVFTSVTPEQIEIVMIPLVLALFLVLRQAGLVARQPVWVYVAAMAVAAAVGFPVDRHARSHPTPRNLQMLLVARAFLATGIVFLTGWGPLLSVALILMSIESIRFGGARVWLSVSFWNLLAFGCGLLAVAMGWVPSFISIRAAEGIGVLSAVAITAVTWMVGAVEFQKEVVEERLRDSEDRFRSLVQHSSDTTLVVGASGLVTYASPATVSLFGKEPEAVVGRAWMELVEPTGTVRLREEMARQFSSASVTAPVELRVRHADGGARYAEAIVADLRGRSSVGGFVANLRDITEKKEAQLVLAHQATHDELTGLPNRRLFFDRLQRAIAHAERDGTPPPIVMFIDLDRFKAVNDSLGHAIGDLLLVEVSRRLDGLLRQSDMLARFGGDEFVVLCEGTSDRESAIAMAERLIATWEEPYVIGGEICRIGLSIGVAFLDETVDAEGLLRRADAAMYRAKTAGPGHHVQIFSGSETESVPLTQRAGRGGRAAGAESRPFEGRSGKPSLDVG